MSAPDIRFHPLTLRFPTRELEREFLKEYFGASRRQVRGAILLIVVLYAGFGYLDRLLLPDLAASLLWIRVAVCALLAIIYGMTFTRLFARWREVFLAVMIVGATAGIVAILWLGGRRVEDLYYVGLILAVLGTNTLFRLRFPVAMGVTILIIAVYEIGLAVQDAPRTLVVNNNFFLLSAALLSGLATYHLERFARLGFLHKQQIEEERARSDALLLNILPAPIAERLKREQGPIAERFDDASVLFADIVGFTELSSTLDAEELVGLLNRVFCEFDEIAAQKGLEKIKTIGDSYMAAAGLPMRRADHLERVAEAALEMQDRVRHLSGASPGTIELRMGIAAGPVVAGVIGQSKFIYDLWGDAVNTASRMESQGVPGKILVTAAVHERLKDRYRFTRREEMEIKGKGRMVTYVLEGRRGNGNLLPQIDADEALR